MVFMIITAVCSDLPFSFLSQKNYSQSAMNYFLNQSISFTVGVLN